MWECAAASLPEGALSLPTPHQVTLGDIILFVWLF